MVVHAGSLADRLLDYLILALYGGLCGAFAYFATIEKSVWYAITAGIFSSMVVVKGSEMGSERCWRRRDVDGL